MDIRVLGALEASIDRREVRLGALKPRAVLAILALHPGEIISTERLIEGLWGEQPPATAVKLVQLYVSQLRKALTESGDGKAIVTRGHGYELQLAPEDIDAGRFEQLLAQGEPREALALWRGPPLDDVAGEPFAAAEIRRLEDLRLAALELAIDADLAAGRQLEVLPEIEAIVAQEPLRERLHAQRMLALYRCGRQADALAAYREARRALVEQVGIEPGPELRRLHEAILAQDAALEAPATVAEWARADAARRLDAAVGRAASERAGLRAAEDEVAGGVEELQATRTAGARIVACPFKGLASFGVDDAEVFFGRERLVAELVARLAGAPLMSVVGPSGSGKSSALRAGLLAALSGGVLPGSERWAIVLLRPGEHPLRALEQATAGITGRAVVAVDQFEELFTACRDERERAAFAAALAERAGDPQRQTLVLVAVRADFYGHCAAYPELSRLMGANHVLVGPMRRDELRRAIELPARQAGLLVDPELADALVADVADEPGALPLLSSSLLELWQRRDGRRLRLDAYDQAGGVRGAVARLAERAYEQLDDERREVARRILLRLAEGEGDAVVRRRVPLAELEGDGVEETLAVLADQRLVTIGEGEVEVAHEALLREWPRLRAWLEEDAEGRRLHAHLIAAARDWEAAGRDPGELYHGARLAATLDWAGAHASEPNASERAFLDAGHGRAEREAERQRRAVRRLRALLASLAVLLALALVAGVTAISQRGEAQDAARSADAQRLGAMALTQEDVDHALLLARQGFTLQDSPQTRSTLLAALLKSPAAIGILRGDGDRLVGLDVSPDGRTLAFMDHDGTLDFVDTRTRQPVGKPVTVPGLVGVIIDAQAQPDVRFSPDGSMVVVGGGKPGVYDARTHRRISELRVPRDSLTSSVMFSHDGRELIARTSWSIPASNIVRFDPRTGRRLGRTQPIGDGLIALMATNDGRHLVTTTADKGTTVWDAATLAPVRRLAAGGDTAALKRDDHTMVVGDADGSVRFVDLSTGKVHNAAGQQNSAVVRAAFSPNGRFAVTAGGDGRVIVWDTASRKISQTLVGPAGQITSLAFSPDGATLYSSALDGRVFVWDLGGARRLGQPFAFGTGNPDAGVRWALSSDGAVLAAGNGDGTVTFIDARTLRPTGTLRITRHPPVRGMAFVPGGRLLVAGDQAGYAALVDAASKRVVTRWRAQQEGFFFPGVSHDGRVLATASWDGNVRAWSLPSGRPLGPPRHYRDHNIGDIDLSPDGRLLAVTRPGHNVEILDVPSMRREAKLAGSGSVWDVVAFSPDGRFIIGGSYLGWVRLWSASTFKPIPGTLPPHAGRVEQLAVSRDGRILATGGPESAVRLWDLRTETPFGAPLPGLPGHGGAPVFSPDGAHLFVLTDGGVGYRWDVRPASWARYACAVAGRRLTPAEWEEALPGRPYAPAC